MARIPVEQKGGVPWWVWLLGLVILAGVIWLLVEAFENAPNVTRVDPTPEALPPTPLPGAPLIEDTITTLDTVLDAGDPQRLVGRTVDVSGVAARQATGDSTYWVYHPEEGAGRRLFVVLDHPGMGTGEGNNMDVYGTIQPVEEDDPAAWGVTGEDAERLRASQVYIRARSLENLSG